MTDGPRGADHDGTVADTEVDKQLTGTVVLVHGGWGHPDDWQWVRAPLDTAGLDIVAMDLPSHNGSKPGIREDAIAIREVIGAATGPVIALGWSYGADALCEAAAVETMLAHLVLLSSIPIPGVHSDSSWIDVDPHIATFPDGRYQLDVDWFLDAEDGRTLPEPVRLELRRVGRRPSNRNILISISTDAWTRLPVTIMCGEDDPFITADERAWAAERFDTRVVPGDHFVLFRTPEVVSDLVLEVMQRLQP